MASWKNPTLRFTITASFLSLIVFSFAIIISFTYFKDSASILKFSRTTINRVASLVSDRVNDVISRIETVAMMMGGYVVGKGPIQLHDKNLAFFLLRELKYHTNAESLYYGLPDGSFLAVVNLQLGNQLHYLSDPAKPLPESAAFGLRVLDRSKEDPASQWTYFSNDFKVVAKEEVLHDTFMSFKRPWYIGASKTHEIYWSEIYLYNPSGIPGVTVGQPIYGTNGKLMGVAGVNLSFTFLSPFLEEQKVSPSSKVFLLKSDGEAFLPFSDSKNPIVPEAYQEFLKEKKSDFLFKIDGKSYLASIKELPVSFSQHWLILVIAPLNDFFSDLLNTQFQAAMISLAILILAALVSIVLASQISKPIIGLSKETDQIAHFDLERKERVVSGIAEIKQMENSIASMRSAIHSFSRYIPKEVVKELVQKNEEITLGGHKKELTIFFSDVAGFTTIAESNSAEATIDLLEEYFDGLSRIILENGGTIDKYMGDGIMAFWGAPTPAPDHAVLACKAALECQAFVRELNDQRKKAGKPAFETRIGINSGTAIVGNIGTEERINYTAMGDAVNIASRLQTINKIYHTSIVISDETHKRIGGSFQTRFLDTVELKGRKEKMVIYELVSTKKS